MQTMDIVEQKLRDRHLQPDRYHVSWDDEVATFLLFNLSGQIIGYQNYRWDADKQQDNDPRMSRYYKHVPKASRLEVSTPDDCTTYPWVKRREKMQPLAVWGLETYNYRKDVLFVVEGVFDATRLHHLSLPCVAALSNDPKKLLPWLKACGRHTIMICDGDKAGRKLAKLGNESVILPDGKDLGDMTDAEVEKVVEKWM